MSNSKCPKCQNASFEISLESPTGSPFHINFVRCSSCKTVVGVLEFNNIGALLYKIAEKLDINLNE